MSKTQCFYENFGSAVGMERPSTIVVYIGEKFLFHRAGMAATQSSETLVLSQCCSASLLTITFVLWFKMTIEIATVVCTFKPAEERWANRRERCLLLKS